MFYITPRARRRAKIKHFMQSLVALALIAGMTFMVIDGGAKENEIQEKRDIDRCVKNGQPVKSNFCNHIFKKMKA